jgi:hypothetical protein
MMDQRQIFKRDIMDATAYNNWPSQRGYRENLKTASQQRESIKKLTESPNRVSLMNKYLTGAATFDKNPQVQAQNFMQSGHAVDRFNEKNGKRQTSESSRKLMHGRSTSGRPTKFNNLVAEQQ